MIPKNPTCKVTNKLSLTLVSDKIQERLAGKTISKESKEQVIQSILSLFFIYFYHVPQKFCDITNLILLPNFYKALEQVLHNILIKISCTRKSMQTHFKKIKDCSGGRSQKGICNH